MEGNDVFTQEIDSSPDDPFAGSDFGDFPEPTAEPMPEPEARPIPEAPSSGLPVVDREGNPIENGPEAAQEPAVAAPAPEPVAPEPSNPENGAQEPAQGAGAPVIPEAPEPVRPPLEDEVVIPEPMSRSDHEALEEARASIEEPEPEPTSALPEREEFADAPDPETTEIKDSKGRITHRRYLIFKVIGEGKYAEVVWEEDRKGNIVKKGTTGAKRKKVALARSQSDALKIGYAAVGSPPRAHLVAVAAQSFQPRVIEPDVPKPERVRLNIR